VLTHRGPDDSGLFVEGRVGLGHRRLAIVDVASGHQPMTNEDGSLRIVYNGEVYNHADHRPWLESRGHTYRTHCDTETILHLYEEKGARCVEDLRGMFAFAIWDARRQELFIARDRPAQAARRGEQLAPAEVEARAAADEHRLRHAAVPPEPRPRPRWPGGGGRGRRARR